jgi:ABC-type branched-subunit amino acid transport system substrate-binding protein
MKQLSIALLAALLLLAPAARAAQGVLTHEVIVGTHMDLSGPLAAWGTGVRNGITMAFDEANAAGGVHDRKLRLIALDDKYDVSEAEADVQQLVTKDGVFAILSPLGTPTVQATLNEALDHHVLHLFPVMADEQSYLRLHPFKFATTPPYANEAKAGLDYLLAAGHARKVGVLYQDNEFGRGVRDATQTALAPHGLTLAAAIGFPPGSANLSAAIGKLKSVGADIVVLGTVVQDTIAAQRSARSRGLRAAFMCPASCYAPETTTLGGTLVEGLYAVAPVPIPYPDDPNKNLRAWVARYERKFGAAPSVNALQAYLNARLFVDALALTGPALTQKRFARTLETMGPWVDPQLGGTPVTFSAENHLGVQAGFLARVHNGRWVTLTGALDAGEHNSIK